ncbi:putative membrane protein [Arcobacter venerupis]|uniref:Membrane protein n=1 Tax=Arcobacter venerupis TaxID=1054033 RepID=A0AAE7BAS7_9BACT|nr:pentapeptide repeat-containing protein [Arcobacter venerupis]QKF66949.1 putative membrane protein [Arcobacter venerupis]
MEEEKLYECEICNKKYPKKEYLYSKYENKCILHCEKDIWFDLIDGKKDWTKSEENIKYFWSEIRKYILNTLKDEEYKVEQYYISLTNVIFPKFEELYEDTYEEGLGYWRCDDWYHNFCDEIITNSEFPSNDLKKISGFNFSNSIFLDVVDFTNYEFEGLVFNNTVFIEECKISNSKIINVSFKETIFQKATLFENSTINFFSYQKDFENCEFYKELTFDNIIFNNQHKKLDLDFKNTKFKELNISNTTFEKGLRFYKESSIKSLNIKNCKIKDLLLAAEVSIIDLDSNKKEIDRFVIKPNNLKSLTISNSLINKDFLLKDEVNNSRSNLDLIDLKESTFKGKAKIQFYNCIKDANFYNTKFEDLADFYRTKFKKVNFERTDFKNIAVFSEAEFHCDVDFKYTKFLGTSIFRDMVITGKLNLRDTIFKEDANFLDITSKSRKVYDEEKRDYFYIGELEDIKVSNRETARVIKNFFDSSNNIIEANRFYKLEMKEREDELEKSFDKGKNIFEYLIFKFHGLSSNYSQNPLLAFFWIYLFSMFYSFFEFNSKKQEYSDKFQFSYFEIIFEKISLNQDLFGFLIVIGTIFIICVIFSLITKFKEVGLCSIFLIFITILYIIYTKDYCLSIVSNSFNPFSIMTGKDSLNIITLIYKIVIAYLIYQFIISIRQNTRRK